MSMNASDPRAVSRDGTPREEQEYKNSRHAAQINESMAKRANSSSKPPNSTLCIPLKYTVVTRPISDPELGNNVLFEALPEGHSFWRKYDLRDSGQLEAKLGAREVFDGLPSLRNIVSEIKDESGADSAKLNEERVLENVVTVILAGPLEQVNQDRARVLRNYYTVERREILLEDSIVYDKNDSSRLNPDLCLKLSELADHCVVAISLTDFFDKLPGQQSQSNPREKTHRLYVYGDQDAVAYATTRVRLLLDSLASKFVDSIDLDLSLQPLVCGPNRGNIRNIQTQTRTKVYFADWLPEVFASHSAEKLFESNHNDNQGQQQQKEKDNQQDAPASSDDPDDAQDKVKQEPIDENEEQIPLVEYEPCPSRNLNKIFISGGEANCTLAKAMLKEVIRRTKPIFKDCVISFAKVELLLLRYQREVRRIMEDLGTFIQLPYLGAARSLVRVQGVTSEAVEKTIQRLMMLVTEIYSANYWIHTNRVVGNTLEQPDLNTDLEFLDKIGFASGATIRCIDNTSFDITGDRAGTKRATGMIKALPIWKDYHHQVRFRLELSIEQREFIAGRKNGKILRIMNNSNVWIKFSPFNEYNFYVNLIGDDYNAVIAGIRLLEDELPSEMSFYIPETYHKQVIGAGGLTIQGIMRKYNVFVKFSNGYSPLPNGFCHVRPDNVLIRCPSKNAKNIPAAKQELLETVEERARDHCNTFIRIPRSHRRVLLSERSGFIHEVESKTNTVILFPESEPENDNNDLIEIRGLGNTSEDASRMVKALMPDDYVFKVAYNSRFEEVVNERNPDFYASIVVPFRIALSIETQVYPRPLEDDDGNRYQRVVLSFSQEHSVGLEDVIQALTAYLRDKGMDIIDRGAWKCCCPGTQAQAGLHQGQYCA
uniref:ARAD1C05830p n=1 Tax=Blastobotrys adeninivorans TaxID=409370 RepID=A0A060SZ56_BLAAD